MEKKKKVNRKCFYALLATAIICCVTGGILYFWLPALTVHNIYVWIYLLAIVIIAFIFAEMSNSAEKKFEYTRIRIKDFKLKNSKPFKIKLSHVLLSIALILGLIILIGGLLSSEIINAKKYAARINVETASFEEDIPTLYDLKKVPFMDTESAKILGDRTIGSLSDVVSQYSVSSHYTTIYYKGKVMKIAPLEYASFFKYLNNKNAGIPGYILVDTETNEAEFVRLENGFQYSPSASFSKDMKRKFRLEYTNLIMNEYSFQIDENGKPYWVMTFLQYNNLFGCQTVDKAALMDAETGQCTLYDIEDLPEWVDYVLSGTTVSYFYNDYGAYQNGFINSIIGQKGCTKTTDDFGYVAMNDDIYIYTGVTSVVSDKSNIGFLLVNSRTGKYKYYEITGAEEHSAMNAAEGVVQNYGYSASFPSLININGEATYAMVLKDSKGLVKMYSMVNVKNYSIVATGESMMETLKNYQAAMAEAGTKLNIDLKNNIEDNNINTITGVINDIKFVVEKGETTVYITINEKVYKQAFSDNEYLILLKAGNVVDISFDPNESENSIIKIVSITRVTDNVSQD